MPKSVEGLPAKYCAGPFSILEIWWARQDLNLGPTDYERIPLNFLHLLGITFECGGRAFCTLAFTSFDSLHPPFEVFPRHRGLTKLSDFPPVGQGWVFRGERGSPLNLDNLSRRDIPTHINGGWFGWHAFRRGLGTRLNEAGVDDKTIQSILHHADVSTTQAYYIKPDHTRGQRGLRKLGEAVQKKYKIKV